MDQRFSIERHVQPTSPVLEHGNEVFPEDLVGLIVLRPAPRLNFKLASLLMRKRCVDKSRFNLCGPKINEFAVVGSAQKKIVKQLRLVFANQAERCLEFINARVGDYQIKGIGFGKIAAGNRDGDFRLHWQTCSAEAGCQIILIDQFVAQSAQLILALESMAHDKIVKLRKLLLCGVARRERTGYRHEKVRKMGSEI